MKTTLVTAPTSEPVSLAEAKLFLRVDGDEEDGLISGLITAARMQAEAFTGRQFVTATWRLTLERWPYPVIQLPHPPLIAVTAIGYVDTSGTTQTLASTEYTVDTAACPGEVVPAYSKTWPSTREAIPNAITVTYTAGYGAATAVPDGVKVAIKQSVAHWYRNRESVTPGTMTVLPQAAEYLLWPFRVWTSSHD